MIGNIEIKPIHSSVQHEPIKTIPASEISFSELAENSQVEYRGGYAVAAALLCGNVVYTPLYQYKLVAVVEERTLEQAFSKPIEGVNEIFEQLVANTTK